MPDVIMENWYGVFLPAGTPPQTRDKLEQALLAAVDFDSLRAEEANHRLGGGQPDRCHGADFPALIVVPRPAATVASTIT